MIVPKPINKYRVDIKSTREAVVYVEATSVEAAENMVDVMDDDDLNWTKESWPTVDISLEKQGKLTLKDVAPVVLAYLKLDLPSTSSLIVALEEAMKEED